MIRLFLLIVGSFFASLFLPSQQLDPEDFAVITPTNAAELEPIFIIELAGMGNPIWSPDGNYFATTRGQTLLLLSLDDLSDALVLEEKNNEISSGGVAFSPDGTLIATVVDDTRVRISTFPELEEVTLLETPQPLGYLRFSPDGQYLAGISGQIARNAPDPPRDRVHLWDTDNFSYVGTVGYVYSNAELVTFWFSSDSEYVYTYARDDFHRWEINRQEDYRDPYLISKQETIDAILSRTEIPQDSASYGWTAYKNDSDDYAILLTSDAGDAYLAYPDGTFEDVEVTTDEAPQQINEFTRLERAELTGALSTLDATTFSSPEGQVAITSLQTARVVRSLYAYDADEDALVDLQTGVSYFAEENDGVGQFISDDGEVLSLLGLDHYSYGDTILPDLVYEYETMMPDTIVASSTGDQIAVFNSDSKLEVVNLITEETQVIEEPFATPYFLDGFFTEFELFIQPEFSYGGRSLRFRDTKEWEVVADFPDTNATWIDLSSDGRLLLVGLPGNVIQIWGVAANN